MFRETFNVTEHSIMMGGHRIHALLLSTFEVGLIFVILRKFVTERAQVAFDT